MTKVQVRFRLLKPLDEVLLERISDAHSIYGISQVKLDPAQDGISVEYDASRLKRYEVEAALKSAGLPVGPVQ